jgi:hypothetical protein
LIDKQQRSIITIITSTYFVIIILGRRIWKKSLIYTYKERYIMTMAFNKETGRTQELADVISNILDLWDDDALPLALEKMKIHSIDAMVDYTVEDIEDMVYDEDDGFEADGITPK